MSQQETPERNYNILVFGIESRGLSAPAEPVRKRNFTLTFERYDTPRRFQEFDGVILFQGLSEKFEAKSSVIDSYLVHSCDRDELDKRKKEASLLTNDGGFICFLLSDEFIDHDDGRDFTSTDLAKFHLVYDSFYREAFSQRVTGVSATLDEFKRFLDLFGAARTFFKIYTDSLNYRVLAKIGDYPVGLVLDDTDYFIPSLIPDNYSDVINEYFDLLADALISVHNKLYQSVPPWIAAYQFKEDRFLEAQAAELNAALLKVVERRAEIDDYKSALFYSGPKLVEVVSKILEIALGVTVDGTDEFREDLKLLDPEGKPIAVCEVKGINRGIRRENINQTDSHRERSGFDSSFPAILIANTAIKSSRNLEEKDQEIALEQIKHAVQMRVLLMRTLDLLGLLRLVLAGGVTSGVACELLLDSVGWLHVHADQIRVRHGEDGDAYSDRRGGRRARSCRQGEAFRPSYGAGPLLMFSVAGCDIQCPCAVLAEGPPEFASIAAWRRAFIG